MDVLVTDLAPRSAKPSFPWVPRPHLRRAAVASLGALFLPQLGGGCRRSLVGAPAMVVATVNGQPLTALDLQRDLAQARLGSEGLGPRSEAELEITRKGELDRLVERTELLQAARRVGVAPSDAEVEKALLSLRSDYPGTSFDELLADEEISPEDLRAHLRDQLTVHKLLAENVFSRVVITARELQDYYEAHPQEFDHPEQVHAEQIVVKTDEEAQALRTAIKGGAAFEELARNHSLSPDGKSGGDLGWFSRGMMPPIFDEVCFSLPVGVLSEVTSSSYGFHVFRVLARRPAARTSFEEAKPELEARLRREKNAKAEAAFVAQLRAKAAVTVDAAAVARVR